MDTDKKLFEWHLKGYKCAGTILQWIEKDNIIWERVIYGHGEWKWSKVTDEYELLNEEYLQVRNVYYRLGPKNRYVDLT